MGGVERRTRVFSEGGLSKDASNDDDVIVEERKVVKEKSCDRIFSFKIN